METKVFTIGDTIVTVSKNEGTPDMPEAEAQVADPGANTTPTRADLHTAIVARAAFPRDRFKTGNLIPGTDITIAGGNPTNVGRPNEVRIMHALANDEYIATLGPNTAAGFVKSGDAAGNFKIVGKELRAAKAVPSGAYSVSAAAVNSQGEAGSTRTVTIFVDPKAPTDIALSGTGNVAFNAAVDTLIGTLTASDPEVGDTFTYSIYNPTGDFKIGGAGNAQLLVAKTPLQQGLVVPVRVFVTDAAGLQYSEIFNITII